MRWLGILIVSLFVAVLTVAEGGNALAVPQPDAEAAYAQGDYGTAYRLFLPLAEQGSVQAQERIAEMYDKGLGVPQDPAKAKEWYRRSAEQAAKDAELKMEASQGMAAPSQSVPPQVIYGTASNTTCGVVPLTPMPRSVPTVVPAAWPPAQARPVQPFYVPVPAPSHYHPHWHHR
jgi:TPR repeat protein